MRHSVRSAPAWLALTVACAIACGTNPNTLLEKGNRLRKQGKLYEASLIYRKAIQKDPDFGATVLSDRLLAKDPRSYDGLRIKGYLALAAFTFADAEKFFRKRMSQGPRSPQ